MPDEMVRYPRIGLRRYVNGADRHAIGLVHFHLMWDMRDFRAELSDGGRAERSSHII